LLSYTIYAIAALCFYSLFTNYSLSSAILAFAIES
jgi:hypothetical protein